ncbi:MULTISPECIES: endolytic transglycosylase MltG [unclassified Clostridium]|uniref:endolytic transglycosylase MltG n=1 Tax=unclassified Clostridium TaxID=2614128 RepID=UPI00033ABC45|nr:MULTISPECIES: endolytic transglycosylase MltG [unclassified Clostridium]MEE0566700.1 endolytic transglycosylase MltG [Clostridium sp.]OKZ85951.1 MAG: aminodeoxychorismate lyase [Clostridium sp. 29_15]CDB74291.1 aminodeoxychorismate lyase [Clostridium sp. CAG:265]
MKKNKRIIRVARIFVIMIIIITIWQCFKIVDTPLKINNEEIVEVAEGDSFYGILDKLSEEGKIKNKFLVKLYLKICGIKPEVLEGTYKLNKSMTLNEFVNLLTDSNKDKVYITIPEGYTIDDIAEKLEENNICNSKEFIDSVKNYELPKYISNNPNKRYNLEGFLFPDTYSFNKNENADFIIKTMLNRFEKVWQEIVEDLNISIPEEEIEKKVNVASIIEKEAVVDSERSFISSVIYNRIAIGMPLQIDATVIYSYGYHIEKMYEKYLEIDSPYNTYMYYGLPIGPISNPGRASLMAALKPKETDYLYYLLESENTHYFTDNYDDFLRRKEELGY